jgi:hypothetical protein
MSNDMVQRFKHPCEIWSENILLFSSHLFASVKYNDRTRTTFNSAFNLIMKLLRVLMKYDSEAIWNGRDLVMIMRVHLCKFTPGVRFFVTMITCRPYFNFQFKLLPTIIMIVYPYVKCINIYIYIYIYIYINPWRYRLWLTLCCLSSRRWQSFPTAPDGTGLTCGQHIESHSCISSFPDRTVTSLFK